MKDESEGGEYRSVHRAERGETLRIPVEGEVTITVDEVMGYGGSFEF